MSRRAWIRKSFIVRGMQEGMLVQGEKKIVEGEEKAWKIGLWKKEKTQSSWKRKNWEIWENNVMKSTCKSEKKYIFIKPPKNIGILLCTFFFSSFKNIYYLEFLQLFFFFSFFFSFFFYYTIVPTIFYFLASTNTKKCCTFFSFSFSFFFSFFYHYHIEFLQIFLLLFLASILYHFKLL